MLVVGDFNIDIANENFSNKLKTTLRRRQQNELSCASQAQNN